MVPKTADGRVLFAVPWLGKVILGTTDTPRNDLAREPLPFKEEVDFILNESARYLRRAPTRADVKSVWVGLRPLVKPQDDDGDNTKGISREHTVMVSRSGMVTVTGGKWTTYRAMAEDVLDACADRSLLERRAKGVTTHLKLVGSGVPAAQIRSICMPPGLHSYGDEQAVVQAMPGADRMLCEGLSEGMVRFAARYEYAITVEDMYWRGARAACFWMPAWPQRWHTRWEKFCARKPVLTPKSRPLPHWRSTICNCPCKHGIHLLTPLHNAPTMVLIRV
jgi:glycerol-3-phosphate dehydrogenase